jgi:tungstate transport system permease protein
MDEVGTAVGLALSLLWSWDASVAEIVGLSLWVTSSAVLLAAAVGLPFGALLGVARFPGRSAVVIALNASMGLPPVVIGLLVYLVLSRSGPLGGLGWLFTPRAMIVAQWVLVLPLIAALTRQVVEALWEEYAEQLRSLGATALRAVPTLLWDGRRQLLTSVVAGFGRAIAEVGAVIIVGGNIAHQTRVMTTAIALETSKGDLALAMALGILLLALSLIVNAGLALADQLAAEPG